MRLLRSDADHESEHWRMFALSQIGEQESPNIGCSDNLLVCILLLLLIFLELPLQLGPGIALDTFRSWAFPESKRRLCIEAAA